MNHLLMLELIGDDQFQHLKLYNGILKECGLPAEPNPPSSWVAEIVGTHPRYGFERRFLPGFRDYSKANGVGSRGVYLCATVQDGKIYDIREQRTWKSCDRRFARFEHGKEIRMTKDEVAQWLANSNAPSE